MGAPILIFDGRCGVCTRSVMWLIRHAVQPFRALPYQAIDLGPYGLTERDGKRAAWWVQEDGRKERGHLAIASALEQTRGAWRVVGHALRIPPVRWAAAIGYRLVARWRRFLPGTTPACRRPWDLMQGRP